MEKENESDKQFELLSSEKRENKAKMIKLLNKLKTAVDKERALLINEDAKNLPILYNIIKYNLQDLKNVLDANYKLERFCVMIYEILFIDSTSFNFEDFENKSNAFELVLNIIKDDDSRIDEEGKYVKEVLEKKQVWTPFIKYIYGKLPPFTFIFCLFVKYFKNNEQIIRFLIDLIQAIKSYTIEVKFNLKDLKNMNENNIAQDFLEIFLNTNYFKLVYENNHILAELLSEEEKAKVLEEVEVNKFLNEINEDLIREKPNIRNERKSDNYYINNIKDKSINDKETDQKKTNENQEIKNDLKSKTKIENKNTEAPKKEGENKHKNNKDANPLSQHKEELKIENGNIIEQIQKLQLEMSEMKKKNEAQEYIIKDMNKRISNQNNMIKELKKENKFQNNTILRNKQNQIKSQQIIRETYNEFSKRLSDVESDLNMIKSRDAIKSFIDYFYNGFRLNGDNDYRDKAIKILEKLNKYNDFNKYDPILGNTLRFLLRKGAEKIYKGNDLAHEINSSEGWLLQLFETIEPNMKYGNIVKKLLYEIR